MNTKTNFQKTGKAVLVLEDGSTFVGYGFGAPKKISGEIVLFIILAKWPPNTNQRTELGKDIT